MNIPPAKSLARFRINTESLEASQHLGVTRSTSTAHLRRQCWNLPPTTNPPKPPTSSLFTQVTCHRRSCQRKPRLLLAQITKRSGRTACANGGNIPAIFSKALQAFCRKPFMRFSNVPPATPWWLWRWTCACLVKWCHSGLGQVALPLLFRSPLRILMICVRVNLILVLLFKPLGV